MERNNMDKQIKDKEELIEAVKYVAIETSRLAKKIVGKTFPITSLTIFAHSQFEFDNLIQILADIGKPYNYNNGPRVTLYKPILIDDNKIIHLRIRKPDPERPQVGCNDFKTSYNRFKSKYLSKHSKNLIFIERPKYEMIEFRDSDFDVLAYVVEKTLDKIIKKEIRENTLVALFAFIFTLAGFCIALVPLWRGIGEIKSVGEEIKIREEVTVLQAIINQRIDNDCDGEEIMPIYERAIELLKYDLSDAKSSLLNNGNIRLLFRQYCKECKWVKGEIEKDETCFFDDKVNHLRFSLENEKKAVQVQSLVTPSPEGQGYNNKAP